MTTSYVEAVGLTWRVPSDVVLVAPDPGDALFAVRTQKVSNMSQTIGATQIRVTSPRSGSLRVGLVGTYPPRPCGLATFTADVAAALIGAGERVHVTALVDALADPVHGAEHRMVHTSTASARSAAATLSAQTDIVLVQHEFGIFGGTGSNVLQAFTDRLTVPYVLTLHTVTGRFEPWERAALAVPLAGAALVLVFTPQAVELLAAQFPGIEGRCRVVPHAAPAEMFQAHADGLRLPLGLPENARLLTTFGLLSPSKGIEHVIRALPGLRKRVGDIRYVIAGRTHPEIVRHHGEAYRASLVALGESLGVADLIVFRDWFHDVEELSALLRSTDLFVTPYSNTEQIVSGALSFAIAAGLPFVSTPYRYATGLAELGCGLIVDAGDTDALADVLGLVLTDDPLRARMAQRSSDVSASRSWPEVGRVISGLLRSEVAGANAPDQLDPQQCPLLVSSGHV